MSRGAVTKSRIEKKGGQAVPTPAIAHEIIPGKYNDHEWNSMLEKDDGDDFIVDIVDDVVGLAMKSIFDRYLEKQLLPFTITQAKDAILQIIEWQFLDHDEGEQNTESDRGWIQDEEPDPSVTDCWAQGSMPKIYLHVPPPSPVIEEQPELVEMTSQLAGEEQGGEEVSEVPDWDKVSDTSPPEETKAEETLTNSEDIQEEPTKDTKEADQKTKKKQGYRPHCGPLKSAGLKRMTESLEDTEIQLWEREARENMSPEKAVDLTLINMPASCHSILRVQQGRPPGSRDVVYDDLGNVVAVIKLNPEKLPSHRVRVGYRVVDPHIEAAEARLDAMKRGHYSKLKQAPSTSTASKESSHRESVIGLPSKGGRGSAASTTMNKNSTAVVTRNDSKTPLPPTLIDSVTVAPGVVIREGDRVKKGPRRHVRKSNQLTEESQKMLRPIAICSTIPPLDVSEILERHTPVLKPMRDSPPIPPIIPHPPQQPRVS